MFLGEADAARGWRSLLAGTSTLHVRGGSVSRRGLIQLAGNRAQAAWAHKPGGKAKLIPSYSSGGSAREGKTAIAASGG